MLCEEQNEGHEGMLDDRLGKDKMKTGSDSQKRKKEERIYHGEEKRRGETYSK